MEGLYQLPSLPFMTVTN